jgi:flavin-dependent dehydrogenase
VRLAVEAGAELIEDAWVSQVSSGREGVRVTTRDGATFRASYLVAADGVNGIVTRRLGMHRGWPDSHLALDIMEETPHALMRYSEPGTLFVSYGYDGSDGYAYVFPKRDHVNVGVGWLLPHFRAHAKAAPYELQQRLIATLGDRGLIEGRSSRAHFTPYLIPVGGPIRETARDRVLVAGDAGGFVNGYTAEGIYYAMVSGELAACALLGGGAVARRYVRAWRREIGGELRDSVLIRRYLFSSPQRVEGMVWGAGEYPAVAQAIVDYATGTVAYKPLRRRLLMKFPRVAARLVRIALSRNRESGTSDSMTS